MFIALPSLGLRKALVNCRFKPSKSLQPRAVATHLWSPSSSCTRALQTTTSVTEEVPFRKQLKDEAKRNRATCGHGNGDSQGPHNNSRLDKWELTVGIEIHAQLNTERKLFSKALASDTEHTNSNVNYFDLALPGSQPIFQRATLIPALRAAIAFGCHVPRRSGFDRKHYFYADQPAGYQITQYYEPFAKDGSITVYDHDGIATEDGQSITIDIKQIQMEQDTARTVQQPPSETLLDFNRVGHPLIEIITLPQIHHPQTAAACVKKIQAILQAVNAVTRGMEFGGLRADVNVSVRPKIPTSDKGPSHGYCGITGLGQRTEIKNLSSFKAVEDAIIAEQDRQISVLESGGVIEGETRGWNLGSTETRKLRGKEGEVDYRYMPDSDLSPVFIGDDLVKHITRTLPRLPDKSISELVEGCGLTTKDAKTLIELDDGARLDYYDEVLERLGCSPSAMTGSSPGDKAIESQLVQQRKVATTAANWILHELGGRLSASNTAFSDNRVTPAAMASIIDNLIALRITGRTAKQLLTMAFDGEPRDINTIIKAEKLELVPLPREEYLALGQRLIDENGEMVQQIKQKGQVGKFKWFVGQMVRKGNGKVEGARAEAILRELLEFKE